MKKQEGKQLVEHRELRDTPFIMIKNENKYFGTCANYKVTQDHNSWEAVEKELNKITWNNIVNVIGVMMEQHEQIKKLQNANLQEVQTTEL